MPAAVDQLTEAGAMPANEEEWDCLWAARFLLFYPCMVFLECVSTRDYLCRQIMSYRYLITVALGY